MRLPSSPLPMMRIVPLRPVEAKQAMERERAKVTADVGLRFFVIACPRCRFEADGVGVTQESAEEKAIREITSHILHAHDGAA